VLIIVTEKVRGRRFDMLFRQSGVVRLHCVAHRKGFVAYVTEKRNMTQ
jgi:hypothetical protein